jgi:hypothetical protein
LGYAQNDELVAFVAEDLEPLKSLFAATSLKVSASSGLTTFVLRSAWRTLHLTQFVDLCDQKDPEDRRQIRRHFSEGFRQKVFSTNRMDFAVEGLSETLQEPRPYRVDRPL